MISSGTYAGRILINGVEEATQVRVHLNDHELAITDAAKPMFGRSILTLHPVAPAVLVGEAGTAIDTMRKGMAYTRRGGDLGVYAEGLLMRLGRGEGSAQGERPVTEFALTTRYTATFMSVEIVGSAGPARSGPPGAKTQPCLFQIEFRVPRQDLPDLLQLAPPAQQEFEQRLDACG